jgi:hypothetical protein
MRGLAKWAIPLVGLAAFVAGVGSASAAECKTYVKSNWMKASCDYNTHHMMMMHEMMAHKTMMHKTMDHKKMMKHKKKKMMM